MTIVNLHPVGWDGMTPRQWSTVRDMVRVIASVARRSDDPVLLFRANALLARTEGRDV